MLKPFLVGVVAAAGLLAHPLASAAQAGSPPAAQAPAAKNDYSDGNAWLCRPGRHDACDVDLRSTIVAADGTLTPESWTANPNAAIDCFYVYPTVSTDTTVNSDMHADAAELNVVKIQFARFASQCRPYAPLYRQITLAALRRGLVSGNLPPLDSGLGFDDVRDAWRHYLEHDNQGRGVVLIGHSQGSFALMELMREEIDGKPVQARLVSAILLGTTLTVPKGKDVGGTFKQIPLCRTATQIGCVMVYASFRSTIPPPANTLFGKVDGADMTAACTNPAALGGGSGQLHSYFSSTGGSIVGGVAAPRPWTTPPQTIDAPYVSVPGLLTAECASNDNATYLKVTVNADASDARADDITGDLLVGTQVQANWGLHLIDVNLSMGNLIDIVGQQAKAYAAGNK
jgi:Protein of unknown function (DUF3089)